MSQLSRCIFVWDPTDVDNLRSAKHGELQQQGILNPTDAAIDKAMTKKEMARHCGRRKRSKMEMKALLEKLITSLATATDTLGVYLLKDEMNSIWTEQKHHLKCIEDPPGVELYRITNYIQKGGVRLPVYKCARGSTSLENFHLHVNPFIPGLMLASGYFFILTEKVIKKIVRIIGKKYGIQAGLYIPILALKCRKFALLYTLGKHFLHHEFFSIVGTGESYKTFTVSQKPPFYNDLLWDNVWNIIFLIMAEKYNFDCDVCFTPNSSPSIANFNRIRRVSAIGAEIEITEEEK